MARSPANRIYDFINVPPPSRTNHLNALVHDLKVKEKIFSLFDIMKY